MSIGPIVTEATQICPMKKQQCKEDIFGTTNKLHIPPKIKLSWNFCSSISTGGNTRLNQKPNAPYIVLINTTAKSAKIYPIPVLQHPEAFATPWQTGTAE
ncbi:hypothetical protein Nepgr_021027 [Nepenthes gracilis]|uniref:Uncharacterized protein n=1 Tax=Nepenthes gracilis TaxID=150966 RepID=A0AAD3XWY9_NEPGR|nr:hypothetical protein Nepgr_021027 [Nepenthes gracilis]